MTIRFLADYGPYKANDIVTLSTNEESTLVSQNFATTNLTGGTAYNPTLPDVPAHSLRVKSVTAAKFAQIRAAGTPSDINIQYRITDVTPYVTWSWNGTAWTTDNNGVIVPVTASRINAISDLNNILECNSSSAINITVKPFATVPAAVNDIITIYQVGTGSSLFVADTGVTIQGPAPTAAQYTHIAIRYRGSDVWAWV